MNRPIYGFFVFAVVLFAATAHAGDTIYVKLCVDEEEPARERAWKLRLRTRLNNASKILERHTGVKLSVLGYSVWRSNNSTNKLQESLKEFAREVSPKPAHIVIGFSSQYRFTRGRHLMGGIQGPLSSHILIRESNPRVSETERLEVLVHELGHFFGAGHRRDKNSVMRTTLGDGRVRRPGFRIDFDRNNAAVIRIIAREIADRRVRNFGQLSASALTKLKPHFVRLARELPDDQGVFRRLQIVDILLRRTGRP